MRAIVLFGHGSRDPAWRAPIEAVAARIAARGVPVRCAWLELDTPDLATAAADLVASGASELVVVPMFLGTGRHAREDLPRLVERVRAAHPTVKVDVRAPVGEDPRVLDLLASIAVG